MPGATTTPSEPLLRRAPWRMGSCRSKLCSGFGIYWFWESDSFLEVSMPTVIVLEQHFVGVLSKKKVDVQSPQYSIFVHEQKPYHKRVQSKQIAPPWDVYLLKCVVLHAQADMVSCVFVFGAGNHRDKIMGRSHFGTCPLLLLLPSNPSMHLLILG